MPNLLFEIGCEELPSWYVEQVEQEAVAHARRLLAEAQLDHGAIEGFATPRRIAILVRDLSAATSRRTELRRGPPASAAFDDAGVPRRAAHGFAEANNIAVEALTVRDTDRGRYAFAEIELGGEPAARVLPGILERLVDELPAPRKMRWADVKTPFVRPIAWLTALLDDELLPLTIAGVSAAAATQGHRFLSPECITLGAATDYEEALRRAFVRPRVAERLRATWDMVAAVGETAAVAPLRDEALLREVANLVEYPVAVVGEFDPRFLALPEEVLTTTMIHHQRFFPTRKLNGALAPKFVAVSNNRVPDESVLATGYRRVLEGRLFDAEFFWTTATG